MYSDVDVLRGALELVERDGGWCQGSYCRPRGGQQYPGWSWAYQNTDNLSFCLEGAIRYMANGRTFYTNYEQPVFQQVYRLEDMVARHTGLGRDRFTAPVNRFNDSDTTSQDIAISVLKSALVEAEQLAANHS